VENKDEHYAIQSVVTQKREKLLDNYIRLVN